VESKREKKLRRTLFAIFFPGVAAAYAANHYYGWMDACIFAYALVVVICSWAVAVSMRWWHITERAGGTVSSVYKWLILLMTGIGISHSVQIYSRSLLLGGMDAEYLELMQGPIWNYRLTVQVVALIYLICIILSRMMTRGER
jgi:hypothetical protein